MLTRYSVIWEIGQFLAKVQNIYKKEEIRAGPEEGQDAAAMPMDSQNEPEPVGEDPLPPDSGCDNCTPWDGGGMSNWGSGNAGWTGAGAGIGAATTKSG